ncbi:MAG TPA: HlyD family secretion protein [Candidatus Eisenbacteria bacterium]
MRTLDPVRPAPAGDAVTAARKPRLGRWLAFAAIGAAVVAGLLWGAAMLRFARSHETTDDAQVEGHIIPVLARVEGYVREVDVVENERVAAGQLLVRLDDRELESRLAQAEAKLETALASSGEQGQAGAQLRAARAYVDHAQAEAARAASELTRDRVLEAGGAISRQDLETAEAASRAADAELRGARDRVAAAMAATRGAASGVDAARAERDEAALRLSYARIVAPDSGVVSRKKVEVGQLVEPGQPLLAVVPLRDVWVVANLKETQIERVRRGQPVAISADSYPGREFHGRVEGLSPATGSKFSLLPPDNASGNFVKIVQRVPVKIVLDEENDGPRPLRPGMSVRVAIRTAP